VFNGEIWLRQSAIRGGEVETGIALVSKRNKGVCWQENSVTQGHGGLFA